MLGLVIYRQNDREKITLTFNFKIKFIHFQLVTFETRGFSAYVFKYLIWLHSREYLARLASSSQQDLESFTTRMSLLRQAPNHIYVCTAAITLIFLQEKFSIQRLDCISNCWTSHKTCLPDAYRIYIKNACHTFMSHVIYQYYWQWGLTSN